MYPTFVLVLIGLVLFFGFMSAILLVVLHETNRPRSARLWRRWRHAFSLRRQIKEHETRRLAAERAARKAEDDARDETLEAERQVKRAKRMEKDAQQVVVDVNASAMRSIAEMGSYLIAEQSTEHIKAIRASNYHAKEKKIKRAVKKAEKHGYKLPSDQRVQLLRMLKNAHEDAIRKEDERQRQAEIKAQIREEERRAREMKREIDKAEKEEKMKRRALEEAIRLLGDTHSDELERLKAELAEAHAATERTKSMAEQTRAGHIYVISNIGSFGRGVFKVGMTRRLEPMDRVKELGDASVPFSFDVHAMISSDDAPTLEAALHRALADHRVNKVNLRKEYFRVELQTIIEAVRENHGEVSYEADPEALEYFESLEAAEVWDGN